MLTFTSSLKDVNQTLAILAQLHLMGFCACRDVECKRDKEQAPLQGLFACEECEDEMYASLSGVTDAGHTPN